ncbi:MAG TPA: PepSY domain-containing protein, partial [Terriglobales bacterium]|nr:PepSY domain-containing protein [Terriglobales bacterium]
MARQNSGEQDSRQSGGLYHFVWRWHFYAGLFTAPFLIVLAVTGALYLFNHEIEGWWYRGLMEVPPFSRVAAASAQEAAVLHAFPRAQVARYTYPLDNHDAAEWTIKTAERRALTVFVDPASTAIKGTVDPKQRLMQIVRDMHASLLLAKPGQYVMELAACWGFILLVTGIFMWWPRRARMRGVVVPRLRAGGRTFWKDIHSVPSMWNAALVVFLILTGLPWSIFWGQQIAKLGTLSSFATPSPNFIRQP